MTSRPGGDPVEDAAAAVRRGELVVVPTDTVYGIGTRPDLADATARLFEAKGRPRDLELPILTASVDEARRVARFDERAERVAAALWPGALTLVLARADGSRDWDLGGDPETVGVRVPDHPLALALLERTGAMAVTSANPSGVPPLRTADELWGAFGERVAVYLCEEAPLQGSASTVVDLTYVEPAILREGGVGEAEIWRAMDVR